MLLTPASFDRGGSLMCRRACACALLLSAAVPVPGHGQAKPVDACAVLTEQAIEAVTGDDVNSGRGRTTPWLDAYVNYECDYRGKAGWRVGINIERGRTAQGVQEYFKTLKGVVTQTTATAPKPVSGLGDEAYWGPIDATSGMLHVRVGTDVVWIHTYGRAPGAGSLEKTRALMEKALEQFAKVRL
jgi:hypothetical protein